MAFGKVRMGDSFRVLQKINECGNRNSDVPSKVPVIRDCGELDFLDYVEISRTQYIRDAHLEAQSWLAVTHESKKKQVSLQ